ncbi:hypothetical protein HPB47_023700 [Ixodes persulcatus]|uniref:Uncharacterized protein n=1 Tax=Ixodes persulcatus TaxID=34615 RepID=A0AC60Q8N8_IXOPE|nr:hypothetical protein HPB47_023700 [Ixodes persulcatus]
MLGWHCITHETDAVKEYRKVLRRLGHDIQVLCRGLFVDPASPWLGASPDRVVFDTTEAISHEVVEVKCPYTMWLAPSPDLKAVKGKSVAEWASAHQLGARTAKVRAAEPRGSGFNPHPAHFHLDEHHISVQSCITTAWCTLKTPG